MRHASVAGISVGLAIAMAGCGGESPTSPTPRAPPSPSYEITTLITVYSSSESGALWSRGTTTSERIGRILVGVSDLGSVSQPVNLNNEGGRVELQAAIGRIRAQFQEADYDAAFGETRANLERYLNDADRDGWSIDGRNGPGRDWPYDSDGNDPDGWTGQIVVTIKRGG